MPNSRSSFPQLKAGYFSGNPHRWVWRGQQVSVAWLPLGFRLLRTLHPEFQTTAFPRKASVGALERQGGARGIVASRTGPPLRPPGFGLWPGPQGSVGSWLKFQKSNFYQLSLNKAEVLIQNEFSFIPLTLLKPWRSILSVVLLSGYLELRAERADGSVKALADFLRCKEFGLWPASISAFQSLMVQWLHLFLCPLL